MADIEVVIKMPEEKLSLIKNKRYCGLYDSDLYKAIANGTPLPKGHGNLFDEKELKKEAIRCEWTSSMYYELDHTLSYMKPIIEADKESKYADSDWYRRKCFHTIVW